MKVVKEVIATYKIEGGSLVMREEDIYEGDNAAPDHGESYSF